MRVAVEIIPYDKDAGIQLHWMNGYSILTKSTSTDITIRANQAGLVSLAAHLLTLAQIEVPTGMHIHLDSLNRWKMIHPAF